MQRLKFLVAKQIKLTDESIINLSYDSIWQFFQVAEPLKHYLAFAEPILYRFRQILINYFC